MKKGESYSLAKTMNQCYIGLGWDLSNTSSGYAYDLDVSLFLLGSDEKLLPAPHGLVYYNNPTFPALEENQWKGFGGKRNEKAIQQQAIWLSADNRDGKGSGDDESVYIDFIKLPNTVRQIMVVASIYDAQTRRQDFSKVKNAFIRVAEGNTASDTARYNLEENLISEISLIFGKLVLGNQGWAFEATGRASHDDLEDLIMKFS